MKGRGVLTFAHLGHSFSSARWQHCAFSVISRGQQFPPTHSLLQLKKGPHRQDETPPDWESLIILLAIAVLPLLPATLATGACKPATWSNSGQQHQKDQPTGAPWHPEARNAVPLGASLGRPLEPGAINCRYADRTYEDVSSETCRELVDRFRITIEHFFVINPGLQ